ncbi:MAG: phosphatase PAP2 family protein [Candidatus Berkiellales bacterium]
MQMLELIAKTGLEFAHDPMYAFVGILGFLLLSKKIYGSALLLVFFTMIYNFYLKSLWQMPLPPPMEGWAFPSGHMHCAMVFWGTLACAYRKVWLTAILFFILCLVGYGLIYHGYHYPMDILGSVLFGSLSITLYHLLGHTPFFKDKPYRFGIILGILGLGMILLLPPELRKNQLWQGLGGLFGLSLGWSTLQAQGSTIRFNFFQNCLLVVIASCVAALLYWGIGLFPFPEKALIFLQLFAVSFWVASSKLILKKIYSNQFACRRVSSGNNA